MADLVVSRRSRFEAGVWRRSVEFRGGNWQKVSVAVQEGQKM